MLSSQLPKKVTYFIYALPTYGNPTYDMTIASNRNINGGDTTAKLHHGWLRQTSATWVNYKISRDDEAYWMITQFSKKVYQTISVRVLVWYK